MLRSGLKLAIIGPPNAGKSSLLNFLMRRDIAIVSNIAGTTRDIIEGHLDIGGYPIILQDTAGIRGKCSDIIEQEVIKRAIDSAKKADIKIVIFNAEKLDSSISEDITDLIDKNTIIVINKIDLVEPNKILDIERCIVNSVKLGYKERGGAKPIDNRRTTSGDVGEFKSIDYKCLSVSVWKNIALSSILKNIKQIAENITGFAETPYITNERHRHHLKQALIYLKDFNLDNDLVLATEDIRMTARCIGAITGVIGVEEILGEIFKKFCIGK